MERRYDIDWLRVVAIGLLIVYHTAIGFQPWGVLIGFIQNNDSLVWLWYPMSLLSIWRIPILFFVSGMGVHFAIRKRNLLQLFLERTKRILIPFLFGVVAIVPLHVFIWQKYYNQDMTYILEKGHLWFLLNIYSYVLLLIPIIYILRNVIKLRLSDKMITYFKQPWIFLYVTTGFIALAYITQPEIYTFYAISWHGYFMGLLAFLSGYLIIGLGDIFWKGLRIWKWSYLFAAAVLYVIRVCYYDLNSPYVLMSLESVCWIFGIFGIFYQYLNKKSKALAYLSKAAYPVYIMHMVFLYLASSLIFPVAMTAVVKFAIVMMITFSASLAFYEFIILRIPIISVLFGVRSTIKQHSHNS